MTWLPEKLKKYALTGYLLLAFLFVQSVSGLMHVDLHDASLEPDIEHHHYPQFNELLTTSGSISADHSVAELQLGMMTMPGSTVLLPAVALFVSSLVLSASQQSFHSRRYFLERTSLFPPPPRHTPPLRAPPIR